MAEIEALLEAEKRGILPPEKIGLLNEARKRGLLSAPTSEIKSPIKESSMLETAGEYAPEIIGGTIGGIVGGIPGAALGGGAGTAYKSIGKQLAGQPATSEEVAKDIAIGGAEQAVGEGLGGLVVKGAGAILRPFASKIIEGIGAARSMFEKVGGRYLPSQVTSSRVLDLAEGISGGSILGGGAIKTAKEGQQTVLNKMADNLAASFGKTASPEEIGSVVLNTIEGGKEAFHTAGRSLYSKVDELVAGKVRTVSQPFTKTSPIVDQLGKPIVTEGVEELEVGIVSSAPIKEMAKDILKKRTVSMAPSKYGDALLRRASRLPDNISFEQAQTLRSELLSIPREERGTVGEKIAGDLARGVDTAMESVGRELAPDAYHAWRRANQFWKAGKERFENNFINRLVEKDAEKVVSSMVVPGAVTPIKKLYKILTPQAKKSFQSGAMQKILSNSADVDGNIHGKLIAKQIKNLSDPTLSAVFNNQQVQTLKNFAKAAELAQTRVGEGTGSMFIQLKQAGAIMQLVGAVGLGTGLATGSEGMQTGSAVVLIAPYVMGKMLTNPITAKWLTEGLLAQAGSSRATQLSKQIVAAAIRLGGRTAVTAMGRDLTEQDQSQ